MLLQLLIPPAHSMLGTFSQHLLYEGLAALGTVSREFDTHIDYFLVNTKRVFRILPKWEFSTKQLVC